MGGGSDGGVEGWLCEVWRGVGHHEWLMSAGVGDHVDGVNISVGVQLCVPRIWHHGGSCRGHEWPWGIIGMSVGIVVGESVSEGRGEEERGLTWVEVTTCMVGLWQHAGGGGGCPWA